MNGRDHRILGGIVGGTVYLLGCKALGYEPTLPGLAISVGVGVVGASLHDLLEPANHPNHRAFFHSITFNGLLAVSLRKAWLSPTIPPEQKILLTIGGVACLSHPYLDAFTPKGLPLL